MTRRFPFAAVVGQDDAKLALTLAAVDPLIGGVLLRGHKGSAKTTLARGLAGLLGRFTELPLGATEDRLIGTLDLATALAGGQATFRPGLLAAADGGVLYVDEVNLLADHLVDVLLDVAVSGENLVERDGVSHRHPARFVLVGSMNPEEGELRPQLLDRFGLCVDVTAPVAVGERVQAVLHRLAFDGPAREDHPSELDDDDLAERLAATTSAHIGIDVVEAASRLALGVGVEGLRADLTLCRAAAANAGLDGHATTTLDDLRRVAPLVLAHRARRGPFDPPTLPPGALDDALDDALGLPPPTPSGAAAEGDPRDPFDVDPPDDPASPAHGGGDTPLPTATSRRPSLPPPARAPSGRGQFVRAVPADRRPDLPTAAVSTTRVLAGRRASDPAATLTGADLRADERVDRARRLVVVCVDLSGSMGAPQRAGAATAAVLGLLDDAYQRRHRVALVAFHGVGAEVVLAPTSSIEIARNRLGGLATGGQTPLAEGIHAALDVIGRAAGRIDERPLLVLITDGRATGRPDALDAALAAAVTVRNRAVPTIVLDCEDAAVPLGLAVTLAAAMGAEHARLADLQGDPASALLAGAS